MIRSLYGGLVHLHPPSFRRKFEEAMLWIFDQAGGRWEVASLFADVGISLGRQWLIRSNLWIWFLASVAGTLPLIIAFGSFLWDRPICR